MKKVARALLACVLASPLLSIAQPEAEGPAQHARRILQAGTEEGVVRPSALREAQIILNRAYFAGSPDSATLALRGHVYEILGDKVESYRSLKQAELLAPDDPWVKLYWAEHYAGQSPAEQERYLFAALENGLPAGPEARAAIDTLMPRVMASQQRARSDSLFARLLAMEPDNPRVRGDYARALIVYFADFDAAARLARETLALSDYPDARQTLALALYGRWAQAARDRKGPEVLAALHREAIAHDPEGRLLPSCLAEWPRTAFVYEFLAQKKNFRRENMHRC